jgi:K+-sensing histidine kinase KdpD
LKQVILNLLSNAVKFTGTGGRVTIAAGREPGAAPAVQVTDTGIGIPRTIWRTCSTASARSKTRTRASMAAPASVCI